MGAEAPQNSRHTQLHTVHAGAQAGSTLGVQERVVPSSWGCSSPAWPHPMSAGAHISPEALPGEGKGHTGTRWPLAASGVTLARYRI